MKSVKEHHLVGTLALALLALCLTGIAYATPPAHTPTPTATSSSTSSALGTGGFASAHTGESNANNSLRIEDRLQAPAGVATPVFASHSCAIGGSLGLSGPGFGVTGGKAKSDPKCDLRETVRILATLNPALALSLLCQEDPAVANAAGPDGCKLPPAPAPQPCAVCQPAADTYSKDEVDAKLERVYKSSVSK